MRAHQRVDPRQETVSDDSTSSKNRCKRWNKSRRLGTSGSTHMTPGDLRVAPYLPTALCNLVSF